jgi:HEAT repeat protein
MISLLWILACGPSSNDIAANLQSSNPMVRQDTAKIARNFGSDAVEASLIGALSDDEKQVRAHAIDSLVDLECGQAVPALVTRLEAEPDPYVQQLVVDALGRLGEVSAVPALIAHLEANIGDPPLNVIWALGALEDARALGVLSTLRNSSDPYVVWNVNQALRNLRPATTPAG